MKAYSYDYQGLFIGEFECDLCQITELKKMEQQTRGIKEGEELIQSVPLLPNYSTLKAPPSEIEEGYQWKFIDGDWYASEIPKPEIKPEPAPFVPTYKHFRADEYPSFMEYLDGVVKSLSGDSELELEGDAQIQEYVQKCLAVKKKYPKPNKG